MRAGPLACLIKLGNLITIALGEHQHLQQRETIIDSAVSDMKIATLIDEIAEFGSLISPGAPIDLRIRASRGLAEKNEKRPHKRDDRSRDYGQ